MENSGFDAGGAIGLIVLALLFAAYVFFMVYPAWRILGRLGYTGGSRLMWLLGFAIVPYVVLWFFAYSNWPVLSLTSDWPTTWTRDA